DGAQEGARAQGTNSDPLSVRIASRRQPTGRPRTCRLSLVAGYAARFELRPALAEPGRQVEGSPPGELVGLDCFSVCRLSRTTGCGLAVPRDRPRLGLCGRREAARRKRLS